MKKIIIGIIVIVIIVWGGYSLLNMKESNLDNPIKIGAVLSLTGYASSYGEYSQKAIELAVDEINSVGGIDGRKITVIFEDDKTDAKTAVSAFQKLVNIDKVEGIIGSLWDFTTQPLLPLALENNIILITPTNFRIENSFELNKNSFAMMPSFDKVINSIDNYIDNQNINKLAVVRFASAFGQEIADTLAETMKERGQIDIIDEKYNDIGGNDFRTTILKLKQQNVDAVFLDMFDSDMVNFLQRAKELSLGAKIITYVAVLDLFSNPDIDRGLLNDIVFINWEVQPKEFSDRFVSKFGIEPKKSADRSYDAVYVLAEAIAKNTDVSKYIENNSFKTINGDIVFTDKHIVETLPVSIDIIKDGKIIPYEK
jgi:branched-chain amino acid transport system substrate-binding protein